MRDSIHPYLLALLSTSTLGAISKLASRAMGDTAPQLLTVAGAIGWSTFWPMLLLGFAYLSAPRNVDYPPKNVLEHSDRTKFAKWVAWAAAGLLVYQVARQVVSQ